ncbi:dodecenoyl-CoA isomerase [Coemansia sp. RSA 25]|nr:dodecenoyl-CoA isomerase [Coemansia sp. RSA 25]
MNRLPFVTRRSLATSALRRSAAEPFRVAFAELDGAPAAQCVATITMACAKANAFDAAALQGLSQALAQVEARAGVRGLVLQSGVAGFFSAGFSLRVFAGIGHADFAHLWALARDVFRRLHALPAPSVAAIDGHALDLGCALAMACQHRYAVRSPALLGLNEVAVGLPVPQWLAERFRDLTSLRAAEELLCTGAALSVARAQPLGLVDAAFDSPAAAAEAARARLRQCAAAPHAAQAETLEALRRPFLARFDADAARDTEQLWRAVSSPATQHAIHAALARLASKH